MVYIDNLEVELDKLELEIKLVNFADDTKGGKVMENLEERDKLLKSPRRPMWLGGKIGHELQPCKVQNHACWTKQPRLRIWYILRRTKLSTTEDETDIGITVTRSLKPSVQCSKAAGSATVPL
jgi:hypothetical protein